ncbi:MAG: CSLREA domain-containing protein [Anaerolineales bacterium]|nr:CSLREA domain-containing protein [Anaerolineales bacterium]
MTTFNVNSTLDELDANVGDGICESTPSGVCTLRAAIQEANSYTEADTIYVPAGTYLITRQGNDDITLEGDLDIYTSMSIVGENTATTIIDANSLDRVFHIHDQNLIGNLDITISGVTIQNGIGVVGGGVLLEATTLTLNEVSIQNNKAYNAVGTTRGGGIENIDGYLTLNNSTVRDNENLCANCSGYGGGIDSINASTLVLNNTMLINNTTNASGGGIFNSGMLLVFNSTFQNNVAGLTGGGLYTNIGTVNLVNSTFSNNGANNLGGGMYVLAGNIYLFNDTITQNHGDKDLNGTGGSGGIYTSAGVVTLQNSILAHNYGVNGNDDDCGTSTLTSAGYNLLRIVLNCTITGDLTGNQLGVNAGLEPLADNGGPTLTHALASNSPAIDAGNPTGCVDQTQAFLLETDQRGYARHVDGGSGTARCDIGAYEYGASSGEMHPLYLPLITR